MHTFPKKKKLFEKEDYIPFRWILSYSLMSTASVNHNQTENTCFAQGLFLSQR